MLDLTKRLLRAAEGGEPVLLASLLEPGPRALQPGARLIVERSGDRMGTLGDPLLDDAVAAHAPAAFARHTTETVYVTDSADLDAPEEDEEPRGKGGMSAHSSLLTPRFSPGATAIYLEVVEHKPVFLIVGAGHIGRSLAKLADFLDFHVAILDDREEFANAERIPEADEIICDDYVAALDRYHIDASTHIVMVTRGHKQDELSLRRCLGRGAAYVGMIGSKRRTNTVLQHLRDEGFDPAELDRVRTPIGLDIGAETPEEIAVAIVAEVILFRHGGSGAPMYYRSAALRPA